MNSKSSIKKYILAFAIFIVSALCICSIFVVTNNSKSYADGNIGNLTINGQAGSSYDGYMVFSANIVPATTESGHKEDVTNINWPSEEIKEVTLNFIRNNGYDNETDSAPDALYYIKTQIENDGITTHSVSDYFSYRFAKELVQNNKINADAKINSGDKTTLDQGYWLFVSPASLDTDKAATCPIWTSVWSVDKTINEKAATNIPTLVKTIKNTEDINIHALDGRVGQEIKYEICGNLPSNLESFPTYRYIVTDNFNPCLLPVLNSEAQLDYTLKDQDGNSFSPDVLTLDTDNNKIEYGFYDLSKVSGITSDTQLFFTYKAIIKSGITAGGLENSCYLTYTNNPVTGTLATSSATQDSTANIYSFQLKVHVVDANSEKATDPGLGLVGAKFGVKVGDEQFIQADGSIGSSSYLFESDADGIITIPGLSSGKYTFVQEYAPQGYVLQDNDVDITVSPTFDNYSLSKLEGDVKGGYIHPIIGTKWYDNKIINIDSSECLIQARICNLHQSNVLPVTGLQGYVVIGILALVILGACGFGLYKARGKSKKINNNQ